MHIVATPIGNLGDITLRALATLAAADLIACEDTRVTRKLLDRYSIVTPLTPYHDHNAATSTTQIAAAACRGSGGRAGIGCRNAACLRSRIQIGPRSAGSGTFGYRAPRRIGTAGGTRGRRLADRSVLLCRFPAAQTKSAARADRRAQPHPGDVVFFETGPRITETLADLAAGLGPREAALCRELTKLHEEVRRDDLETLARTYAAGGELRGEFVLAVAPPAAQEQPSVDDAETLLRLALARVSLKDAVGEVALATGLSRRDLYQRALVLVKEQDHRPPR